MFRGIIPLLIVAGLTVPAQSQAGSIPFDGSWKEQRFSLFSKNSYGFRGARLDVSSNGSVSMAYVPVGETDWGSKAASWSWAVSKGVPATDLSKKGGDDRNLSLYMVFLPEAEARALKGAGIRKLLASDAARVLVYVWGGAHQRGDVLDSPYLGARGKTLILRGTGEGEFSEKVDLARDYKRVFGGEAGALVGLAVSADSDDTKKSIQGAISGLTLN